MPKSMSEQPANVRLLTLINVDNAGKRAFKRRRTEQQHQVDWHAIARSAAAPRQNHTTRDEQLDTDQKERSQVPLVAHKDEDEDEQTITAEFDAYDQHWHANSPLVNDFQVDSLAATTWTRSKQTLPALGHVSVATPTNANSLSPKLDIYNPKLVDRLQTVPALKLATRDGLLPVLASYRDLYYPKLTIAEHDTFRATLSMHAMNHVMKLRSRVLKNNDHLAKLASEATAAAGGSNSKSRKGSDAVAHQSESSSSRNTQDQGFTRPKVLVLAPFRNSALRWVDLLTQMTTADSIDGKQRFDTEYSLPKGAVDKLAQNPENYPPDHVATFTGNIDDSFRVGLKMTRKTVKLFAEFYSCDVVVASPLGLRTTIEKDDDDDFLSSIELLIVDQMDVMTMQNWDHVQFVMDRLNKIPQDAHGCDFSRVKPWYLDGKSGYLRQSVLLSSYETPEMRSLFSHALKNVAGKVRAEPTYPGILSTKVPRGVKQVFTRFDVQDVQAEDDLRFQHFTTKTIPMLLKSAVSSSQTLIFVPSYFDFVRLKKYLKALPDFSFASISEYTPTPDVSRARGAFFAGKVSFLLVTERFHFFRRYRLRGAKTMVFYAPPDHAEFYSEVVSFPFARANDGTTSVDEADVDPSELSCHVLFSKCDFLRMQRIVGTEYAREMMDGGQGRTKFTFVE
ncbi:rRNA-binding ribosome biosynthesis protein utp25 [Microbotryomycetes sp. JL201]|nr:rRNA-binding ribosome biosynthesis protein utp25 [Microbotryomycetes sp. JL201]